MSSPGALVVFPDGVKFPSVRYGDEYGRYLLNTKLHCDDCGVSLGKLHNPGCALAQCPRCWDQLVSCGCFYPDWRRENNGLMICAHVYEVDGIKYVRGYEINWARREFLRSIEGLAEEQELDETDAGDLPTDTGEEKSWW